MFFPPSRPVMSCTVVGACLISPYPSSLLRLPVFILRYSYPPSSPTPPPSLSHDEATVVVERRRGTVGPGERLPVLLKFCALKPAASRLTVSAVRWTVFHWSEKGSSVVIGDAGERTVETCPRVSVSHRLEGRGKLLHGTLEQRAARQVVLFRGGLGGLIGWLDGWLDGWMTDWFVSVLWVWFHDFPRVLQAFALGLISVFMATTAFDISP